MIKNIINIFISLFYILSVCLICMCMYICFFVCIINYSYIYKWDIIKIYKFNKICISRVFILIFSILIMVIIIYKIYKNCIFCMYSF